MSTNIRRVLESTLKPLLPKTWRIVPVQRSLDALSTTTVMLRQMRIERNAGAPASKLDVHFTITIAVPNQDLTKAEPKLDDEVIELLLAIDQIEHAIIWSTCEKVIFENYPAYDIGLVIVTNREEN